MVRRSRAINELESNLPRSGIGSNFTALKPWSTQSAALLGCDLRVSMSAGSARSASLGFALRSRIKGRCTNGAYRVPDRRGDFEVLAAALLLGGLSGGKRERCTVPRAYQGLRGFSAAAGHFRLFGLALDQQQPFLAY